MNRVVEAINREHRGLKPSRNAAQDGRGVLLGTMASASSAGDQPALSARAARPRPRIRRYSRRRRPGRPARRLPGNRTRTRRSRRCRRRFRGSSRFRRRASGSMRALCIRAFQAFRPSREKRPRISSQSSPPHRQASTRRRQRPFFSPAGSMAMASALSTAWSACAAFAVSCAATSAADRSAICPSFTSSCRRRSS